MSKDVMQINVGDMTKNELVDTHKVIQKQTKHQARTFTREELSKIISAQRRNWEATKRKNEEATNGFAKIKSIDKCNHEYEKCNVKLLKKEMVMEAKIMLSERGLPLELLSIIDLTNKSTILKSVNSVQQSFEQAVEKAVNIELERCLKLCKSTIKQLILPIMKE